MTQERWYHPRRTRRVGLFLAALDDVLRTRGRLDHIPEPDDAEVEGVYTAVLDRHGREWTRRSPEALPDNTAALEIALTRPGLHYVEGIARAPVNPPYLDHVRAWCVDDDGFVLDPEERNGVTVYVGVALDLYAAMLVFARVRAFELRASGGTGPFSVLQTAYALGLSNQIELILDIPAQRAAQRPAEGSRAIHLRE